MALTLSQVATLGMNGNVAAAAVQTINGAGATFPYPLYSKWFSEYRKVDPSLEINYQSIGSGGGVRQLLEKTIDFGASDAPMTAEQMAKTQLPILHIPTVLGAVAITYHLPGFKGDLRLSSEVLAELFLGKITKWNDPKLKALNPSLAASLPDTFVMVAHRSDGSGTSAIFTDYLSKVSPEWKSKVGAGTALKWPVGLGGKGNEGVTGLIKQTPGGLGYVELVYAETNHLPVARLKNRSGVFVAPSPHSVSAAAAAEAANMPKDFRVSITDAQGKDSYPISAFTYLLVYQRMKATQAPQFRKFLDWALTDGQKLAQPLSYAPLPAELVKKVKEEVAKIQAVQAVPAGK
ncbi:MAG: phosphate ABC transporter substrate-binding protein PstS [Methylotenera sp.]|nr:phosphate ABC transporter substrate-binding protein PstS [Oligoflexia bacterium]